MKYIKSAVYFALMLGYFAFVGVGNTMLASNPDQACYDEALAAAEGSDPQQGFSTCMLDSAIAAEPQFADSDALGLATRVPAGKLSSGL